MQKDGLANALKHDMSTAQRLPQNIDEDLSPRRPASVEAIDARLSVWGQASRNAITRRAKLYAKEQLVLQSFMVAIPFILTLSLLILFEPC